MEPQPHLPQAPIGGREQKEEDTNLSFSFAAGGRNVFRGVSSPLSRTMKRKTLPTWVMKVTVV